MLAYVIVEHAESGQLTLHRAECRILNREGLIKHPAEGALLTQIDHLCKVCIPEWRNT